MSKELNRSDRRRLDGKAHTTAFHNARMIFGDDMPVFELVSDVSEDAVAKFAKNMGYNRYTTNWMDVVTDPEIDLVDVATPNCMHYEMAKATLEHGKHVFCEKPLAQNAEELREDHRRRNRARQTSVAGGLYAPL